MRLAASAGHRWPGVTRGTLMCLTLLLKILFGKLKLHLLSPRETARSVGLQRHLSTSEAVVGLNTNPFYSRPSCLHRVCVGPQTRPSSCREQFGVIVTPHQGCPPGHKPRRGHSFPEAANGLRLLRGTVWWDLALKTKLAIQSLLWFHALTGLGMGKAASPLPTRVLENISPLLLRGAPL